MENLKLVCLATFGLCAAGLALLLMFTYIELVFVLVEYVSSITPRGR